MDSRRHDVNISGIKKPPLPAWAMGAFSWCLLLDERTLDQVVTRLAHPRRDLQAEAVEHFAGLVEHARAAADHRAVVLRVDRWQTDVAEQLAAAHQVGQTALVLERLAGPGREVD